MPIDKVRRAAKALEAELIIQLRWRGGDLDRLVDEGHSFVVGKTLERLRSRGWEVRTEVSYSIYGERGSIDVLAWHEPTRSLLVVEVKTSIVSGEETLRKHDEKARLAGRIAVEQFGWRARIVSRLLILPDLSTPRRQVERVATVMHVAYPDRGVAVREWLARPAGPVAGIVFLPAIEGPKRGVTGALSRRRVRRRRPTSGE